MRWRIFWHLAGWLARNGYRVEVRGTERALRGPGYFIAFTHESKEKTDD